MSVAAPRIARPRSAPLAPEPVLRGPQPEPSPYEPPNYTRTTPLAAAALRLAPASDPHPVSTPTPVLAPVPVALPDAPIVPAPAAPEPDHATAQAPAGEASAGADAAPAPDEPLPETGPLTFHRPDMPAVPALDLPIDPAALRRPEFHPSAPDKDEAPIARALESFARIAARAEREHGALLDALREEARAIASIAAQAVDEADTTLRTAGDRIDEAATAALARTDAAVAGALALIGEAEQGARRLIHGTAAQARKRVAANGTSASTQIATIVADLAANFTAELAAIVKELREGGKKAADAVSAYTAGGGGEPLRDAGDARTRLENEAKRAELPKLGKRAPKILEAATKQADGYAAQGPQIIAQFDQSTLGKRLHDRQAQIGKEGDRAIGGATTAALKALGQQVEAARNAIVATRTAIAGQIAQGRASARASLRQLAQQAAGGAAAQAEAGFAGLDGAARSGVPAIGNLVRGTEHALSEAAQTGGGALDQTAAAIGAEMPDRIGNSARRILDRSLRASGTSRAGLSAQAGAGLAAIDDGGARAAGALETVPDTPLATLEPAIRQQADAFSLLSVGVARAADGWAAPLATTFKRAIDQTRAELNKTDITQKGSFANWKHESRAAKDRFLAAAITPYLKPELAFETPLKDVAATTESEIGRREKQLERALQSGIIDVVDEGAASAAVRGITARQGDFVRSVFPSKFGSLGDYLQRLHDFGDLSDNDLAALTNYLNGNTAAGAAAELRASIHWYNDEEARIEEIMRSLKPEELAALTDKDKHPDYAAAIAEVRDNLGGTDLDVVDALAAGNHARADAYRLRDKVNEARAAGNDDALNAALTEYSHASADRGWDIKPADKQSDADARRVAVQRELALVIAGTEPGAAPSTISAADAAKAVEVFALRPVEVTQGGGDGPPVTYELTVTGANRDLAEALIRQGEGSIEARAARLGVEAQRPDGAKLLNVDTAMVDPRLNPANPVSPDERKQAKLEHDQMLQLFASKYANAGGGVAPDDARRFAEQKILKSYGEDPLSADIARALIRDGYAKPDTAARAMLLSARGAGTDEELAFRFSERMNRSEIADMRTAYKTLHKEGKYPDAGSSGDLDRDMGTFKNRDRWFNEFSGDDALRLERAFLGQPRNDRERIEVAAFAAQQQRENTGWFGRGLADGSLAEESLAGQEKALGAGLNGATIHVDGDGNPVWMRDGKEITPGAGLFDEDGRFTGDRATFLTTVTMTQGAAENYGARIDAYANFAATTVAVLGAIAATVATVLTAGAASPLLMATIAGISGLAGMGVRAAISGGRYGWEQAATDLGMTAVQALTAGVGQHIALVSRGATGGLAAGMTTFRSAQGLATKMGAISGSALMDMVILGSATGGIGGLGSSLFNEATWQKGFGDALGEVLLGTMRGILAGATTSLASQAFEKIPVRGTELGEAASQSLNPLARAGFRAATSAIGGFAGHEVEGVLDPHRRGDAGDLFQSGLQTAGQSAVQDFVGGHIEAHVDARRATVAQRAAMREQAFTAVPAALIGEGGHEANAPTHADVPDMPHGPVAAGEPPVVTQGAAEPPAASPRVQEEGVGPLPLPIEGDALGSRAHPGEPAPAVQDGGLVPPHPSGADPEDGPVLRSSAEEKAAAPESAAPKSTPDDEAHHAPRELPPPGSSEAAAPAAPRLAAGEQPEPTTGPRPGAHEGTASAVGEYFRGDAVKSSVGGATHASVGRAIESLLGPGGGLEGVATHVPEADGPAVRLKTRTGAEVEVEVRLKSGMPPDEHGDVPVARFVHDEKTGRYVVEVSTNAPARQVERALAHEFAEIRAGHGMNGEPTDVLKPGGRGATLSPHDEGRVAEFGVLARQLADPALDPQTRARLQHDSHELADALGLLGGTKAAADRAATARAALPDDPAIHGFFDKTLENAPNNPFIEAARGRFRDDLDLFGRRYAAALAMGDAALADTVVQDLRRLAIQDGEAWFKGNKERPKSTTWLDYETRQKIAAKDPATQELAAKAAKAFSETPYLTDADRKLLNRVYRPDPGYEARYSQPPAPESLIRPDPTTVDQLAKQRVAAQEEIRVLDAQRKTAPEGEQAKLTRRINELGAEIKRRSEDLGVLAGRAFAEDVLKLPIGSDPAFRRGSGVPDLLYVDPVTGRLSVVECKGGSAELGIRRSQDETAIVQQGTREYLESLAADMRTSSDDRTRKAGRALQEALGKNPPTVDYYLVSQPIDNLGRPTTPVSAKFDLSPR